MKKNAVYGVGIGINGREAAMQATQHALDQLGAAKPTLGVVFAAQEFEISEVLTGLMSLLGDTPLWGFSTLRPVTMAGDQPRSVVVMLLTGADLKAEVQWLPNFGDDSAAAARQLVHTLRQNVFLPQDILLAADGLNGSLAPVCEALSELKVSTAGGTAAGEPWQGKTFVIGKNQAGSGGLAAAVLNGRLRLGVGVGHGWQNLGVYFTATRTRDVWVQTLDNAPAAEMYGKYFGYTAREWAFPPLSDMARLYPLGVEPLRNKNTGPFMPTAPGQILIRSALRVEVDGSLRMSGPVPQGSVVNLMAGDPEACLKAAGSAAAAALAQLAGARPLMALVLIDAAWLILFESRPSQLATALNEALGDIPWIGAYTYSQLHRPDLSQPPVLHNQTLEVIAFGEAERG